MKTERDVYAVDLDGTLAFDDPDSHSDDFIGEPVPAMLEQVKTWLTEGREVWIFTARLSGSEDKTQTREMIQDWCEQHGLGRLKVTGSKSWRIQAYFDDRCYHVLHNQGVVTDVVDEH